MDITAEAIRPLLQKLNHLLVGEFTLEIRARKSIECLLAELTLMDADLCKLMKGPSEQLGYGIKIWAESVRKLSYQMDDIINFVMVRVGYGGEPAKSKNKIKMLLKKILKLFKSDKELNRISDILEEAVSQAKQLSESPQRYEDEEMEDSGAGAWVDPRVMTLYKDVSELIAIIDSRDKIINMLSEGNDCSKYLLKTVSIVGCGGLGKTTLAKAVYDKIKGQFDCGAFVSVSQNPDMKKVFMEILFELDKQKCTDIYCKEWEEKHLTDELIEFLNGKRYLIVIDDIWNETLWEYIKCAFSKENNLGS